MYQHGLVDYIARRHMPKAVRRPPPFSSTKRRFTLLDLSGAFILLTCGLCLSLVVFFGEIIFYHTQQYVNDKIIWL